MNLNEAIDTLIEVASAVFPESQPTIDRDVNTKALKGAIEAILEARGIPVDVKMIDPRLPPTNCKVYVPSHSFHRMSNLLPVLYTPQHRPYSITRKPSAHIPHAVPVLTPPLSKRFVPLWPSHLISHR